jgi:hypothetical protein
MQILCCSLTAHVAVLTQLSQYRTAAIPPRSDKKTLMHLDDLDSEEQAALHTYKAASSDGNNGSLCFDVNEALESALWLDELPDTFKQQVTALDRVFSRRPLIPQELRLYRGLGSISMLGSLKIGRKFRSLSFWSATSSPTVAGNFVKPQFSSSRGGILTLSLPVGTPVYDMETLIGAGHSEREYLLPRGLLWKILQIQQGDISDIPPPARKNLSSLALITLQALSPCWRPPR